MLNQDNNFYLISLIILITSLLDNLWMQKGELLIDTSQHNWYVSVSLINFIILGMNNLFDGGSYL